MAATASGKKSGQGDVERPVTMPADVPPWSIADFGKSDAIMAGGPLEPVRLRTDAPMPDTTDRIPVYYLDDQVFTVPREAPMNWAVQLLHTLGSDDGQKAAEGQVFTMRRMLGEDGYRTLVLYPQLTKPQYEQIMAIIFRSLMGRLEAPKADATA